jgi:hypothetical protein
MCCRPRRRRSDALRQPAFLTVWRDLSHPDAAAIALCRLAVYLFGGARFAAPAKHLERVRTQDRYPLLLDALYIRLGIGKRRGVSLQSSFGTAETAAHRRRGILFSQGTESV